MCSRENKQSHLPPVSEAELQVLKVLWRKNPQSSAEVIMELQSLGWSDTTVKTLLSRLVKKGVLTYAPQGNRYFYSPLIDEAAYGVQKGQEIARQLSGGPAFPVMLQFIRNAELSEQEIEELTKLLKEKNHGTN